VRISCSWQVKAKSPGTTVTGCLTLPAQQARQDSVPVRGSKDYNFSKPTLSHAALLFLGTNHPEADFLVIFLSTGKKAGLLEPMSRY